MKYYVLIALATLAINLGMCFKYIIMNENNIITYNKLYFIITKYCFSFIGCSNGFLMRSDEYNEETRDFLLLPDENNNLQFVKLTRDAPETRYDPKRDVKFNLYTR